jgi:hypothetical protein
LQNFLTKIQRLGILAVGSSRNPIIKFSHKTAICTSSDRKIFGLFKTVFRFVSAFTEK